MGFEPPIAILLLALVLVTTVDAIESTLVSALR